MFIVHAFPKTRAVKDQTHC